MERGVEGKSGSTAMNSFLESLAVLTQMGEAMEVAAYHRAEARARMSLLAEQQDIEGAAAASDVLVAAMDTMVRSEIAFLEAARNVYRTWAARGVR